ncbi:membrane protein FxsA [Rhizobium sp. 32-5/1]|uniref:FxsA family protein n=1 Tax=Rhizobium sp. 32-5/1 TaxID=3019602 RepID=UPI00240DDCFA|nr:FxsA family protein [Rhizobium sp. 32-5/1]WEZ81918.1 membrane protein FxsA [Rhizobium sp. 32-5/1]
MAEIATFVLVGREVGIWTTLLLVLLSGLVGAVLLRIQGLGVLRRISETTGRGVDPGRELVHGVMIVLAAFLLIIPGFITDIFGLLLFIPAVREAGWQLVKSRLTIVTSGTGFRRGPETSRGPDMRHGSKVIDLDDDEFSHDDPRRPPAGNGADDKDRLR